MDLLKNLPFILRVSPIGIATHKYSFKKRLILNLSSPHNNEDHLCINELIDKDLCSLSYIKLDDAIRVIQEFGPIVFAVRWTFLMPSNNCLLVQNNGIFFVFNGTIYIIIL